MRGKVSKLPAIAGIALMAAATSSQALILTQAGIDAGFTLSTVVSGLPGSSFSPSVLGVAVNSDGNIVLSNAFGDGKNYVFTNTDNQTAAQALNSVAYPGSVPAIVNANGILYEGGGVLHRLNNDGSVAQVYNNIPAQYGMWTNPVSQHIIAVGLSGLIDIDVNGPTPTFRQINSAFSDGVTVSHDGQFVYTNSAVYRIDTGALVASYFVSGADGMGIIASSNALNGNVIVNTTNGNLVMLDPLNNFSQTIIASGGVYGDFTGPDFTTGTLLISQSNSLWRLGCGPDCGVGSAPPPNGEVPIPGTLALVGLGLIAFTRIRRLGH